MFLKDVTLSSFGKLIDNTLSRIAMQFSGRRKKLIGSSQNDLYDHCLQFYGQPPLDNISLTEFENFAVERLKCESSAWTRCI